MFQDLPKEPEIIKTWDANKPLVSIICLTYNHEKFLSDAIKGFLIQQTSFPYEIVFHDDASTDGTRFFILELQRQYPKIVRLVLQKENIYSTAGNVLLHAISACRGKYISFCEGDDYWTDPNKLEKQVSFLEANPDFVITYTDCQPFDENGEIDADFGGARRDLSAQELKKAPPIFTLTACFRNVLKIPPEAAMAKYGDLFMWSLLGHYGKGKYLPEVQKSRYRVHSGGVHSSANQSSRADMKALTLAALLAYYKRINDPDLIIYFRRSLLNFCIIEKIKEMPFSGTLIKLKRIFLRLFH